ncbi:MAG: hypothetical protein AB1627_13240 [Chloroflexota bacterium]
MKRRLTASMAVLTLLGALSAQMVTATHVAPGETMPGNYQCPADSTKIDPVGDGTYALVGGGSITIDVRSTGAGTVFDFWTSGATIGAIVVKGGPNYHTYIYSPEVSGDTGLHAPLNLNNGKWYGLSHLCIESTKKSAPPKK